MIWQLWRTLRARRKVMRADSGEICHDPDCLRDLTFGELWETHHHQPVRPEIAGFGGGTYMVGYWCPKHAPAGAVRWRP